jgi:Tol biopolymer transport system component
MMVVQGKRAQRVDTRAAGSPSPATYSAWHPSGKLIAFSCNKLRQFIHKAGPEPREVVDLDSGLAIYSTATGRVTTDPAINEPGRLETFPAWSPDGCWLYFSSAPQIWAKGPTFSARTAEKVRYDLVRAHFDPATGQWGAPETLLTARATGKSLLEPRVSPDGRFLAFVMCDYGSFPILQPHSDLYLMDLRAGGFPYRRLAESPESPRDSWHSWSSNSRWLVFSRKRDYGLFARPYLRYVDANGIPGKPFVIPQSDPTFYDSYPTTYNAPELVTGPVKMPPEELARAANAR